MPVKNFATSTLDEFHEVMALQALRAGERGAEMAVLEALKQSVLKGRTPDPLFQSVANAIVAKAVISGKFPSIGKGRPTQNFMKAPNGWEIAHRHISLMDQGTPYAGATEIVASEFNLVDRQIERIVSKNKSGIEARHGKTKDERELDRTRPTAQHEVTPEDRKCIDSVLSTISETSSILETHLANEAKRNSTAELNQAIGLLLKQQIPDDIK